MKVIKKVEECVCGSMPDIQPENLIGCVYYRIQCLNCGRGGVIQYKTTYQAIKDWNDMQTKLKVVEDE